VFTSLLMQMKLVGMNSPWSSAQIRAARQIDLTVLAQLIASTRFFAAEAITQKPATSTAEAAKIESKMIRRLVIQFELNNLR